MPDRELIRCPGCRASVPLVVVWAAGDVCPRCRTSLGDAPSTAAPLRRRFRGARDAVAAVPPTLRRLTGSGT